MGKWGECSQDIVSFLRKKEVAEDVNVGDYYETHKLGLRFYLFTKKADIQTDEHMKIQQNLDNTQWKRC